MSIIFFDGFDYLNGSFGGGGRHWDQDSQGGVIAGRFGGRCMTTAGGSAFSSAWNGAMASFPNKSEIIVGYAMKLDSMSVLVHPFLVFFDNTTAQVSLWVEPGSQEIVVMTGRGTEIGAQVLGSTGYVPPLNLWFYIEVKMLAGTGGGFEIQINGQSKCIVTGVQTQQSGVSRYNKIGLMSLGQFGPIVYVDDLYILDTQDATNSVDFLGEVRVQTKYPDAEGYQVDFLPSTGIDNSANVDDIYTTYTETGLYNYSGTVGAIDLYSIGNFTISGTIFAVQENMSFRKDDVGNRTVRPILRTASTNYTGDSFPCYSDYTYANKIWEINPQTGSPWLLTDLNNCEFGITVDT